MLSRVILSKSRIDLKGKKGTIISQDNLVIYDLNGGMVLVWDLWYTFFWKAWTTSSNCFVGNTI